MYYRPALYAVEFGEGLTYVWKYRNRLFFVQGGSMNAWYLGINSIGGALLQIPLAGATKLGGDLLFGASARSTPATAWMTRSCLSRRSARLWFSPATIRATPPTGGRKDASVGEPLGHERAHQQSAAT